MVGSKDEQMRLTVGTVARLAGVTVRTLHHYDEIGLLKASDRSHAGYRRYAEQIFATEPFSGSSGAGVSARPSAIGHP